MGQAADESSKGNRLMDKITNHVMTEGFNDKIRNLREEFFSKVEFKN